MNSSKSLFCFLASGIVIAAPMFGYAQNEISRRTELQTGTVVSIQTGTMSTRDVPAPAIGVRGMGIEGMRALGAGLPGAQTVTSEVEIITYGYQIPDFNPDDLYTHQYNYGMFAGNGNGSGSAYPDIDGYVEYEMTRHLQEPEMRSFLYSVSLETGEAKVFINVDEMTVNMAISVLTNLAMNSRTNEARIQQMADGSPPRIKIHMPAEIGNQRTLGLHGDYLTLEDIQEEIFRQTRCDVEEEDGRYYLLSCK